MGFKGHNNYTNEVKTKVVEAYHQGLTFGKIAEKLNLPKSSVFSIVSAFKAKGTVESGVKFNGRPRKSDAKTDALILKIAQKDPSLFLTEIQAQLEAKGVHISTKTIKLRLKEAKFQRRPPKRNQHLKKKFSIEDSVPPLPPPPPPTMEQLQQQIEALKEENAQLLRNLELKDALNWQLNEKLNRAVMCCSCTNQYSH